MKTVRFIIIAILGIAPLNVMAQYLPLPKDSAIWYNYMRKNDGPLITHWWGINSIHGDTIFNNEHYKILYYYNTLIAFLRQDSLGRVYYCYINSLNNERLLYDFSMDVGDTVTIYIQGDYASPALWAVIETDSTYIAGEWRKLMKMGSGNYPGFTYWIEGIGSNKGLFGPTGWTFETYTILTCYQDGQHRWPNTFPHQNGYLPYFCGDNIGFDKLEEISSIRINPNPASSSINVFLPEFQLHSLRHHIKLLDINGRTLEEFEVAAGESMLRIELAGFRNGLYFLQCSNEYGVLPPQKLIVAH